VIRSATDSSSKQAEENISTADYRVTDNSGAKISPTFGGTF
jgi:hypothetical protein